MLTEPRSLRYRPTSIRLDGRAAVRRTSQKRPAVVRLRFAMLAALIDTVVIAASAVGVFCLYRLVLGEAPGAILVYLAGGVGLGLAFVAASVLSDSYDIVRFLTFAGHARRLMMLWNAMAVVVLLAFFITQTTAALSRLIVLGVYGVGYGALLLTRFAMVTRVRHNQALGRDVAQRVFLVGDEAEIARFAGRHDAATEGLRIVSAVALRGPETLADDLALAAASARMLRPDDVFILLPWSQSDTIDACITAFMRVPAAIHLGPERVLDRFLDARISRIGPIATLNLVRHPLTRTEIVVKRCVDLVLAALMLVLLLPLFVVIALAIKVEDGGPILFLQRRYGFNQEAFRIVKFRSMRVAEDGGVVTQVSRDDARITRIGRVMRRFNIDEMPQLINVLRGDMSLVGPRPHALAHDQLFDRTIAAYARRHNVKPGITGWAQVNGFRGPITSDTALRQRIEHDLFYIDNWSLPLDLRILVLTLLSSKAFENAF